MSDECKKIKKITEGVILVLLTVGMMIGVGIGNQELSQLCVLLLLFYILIY